MFVPRRGRSRSAIGAVHPHEAFVVRSEQDGWYQIDYQGQAGYVSADSVKVAGTG